MNLAHTGKEHRGKGSSGHREQNPNNHSKRPGSQDETVFANLDKWEIWDQKAFNCYALSDTLANVHSGKRKELEGIRFEMGSRSTKRS